MNSSNSKRITWLVGFALAAVTAVVYWQVLGHYFVPYHDDGDYVTWNAHVLNGLSLRGVIWALTRGCAANWHPVTWISHMLDVRIYGLNPMGHHLTNLLLHIANTILLFIIFNKLTGRMWRSAFIAALFALHPLHVESVAWVG